MSASVFGTNDSALEQLLNQAKAALSQKEKEKKAEEKAKKGTSDKQPLPALSVSLRLDTGYNVGNNSLLTTDPDTGMTKLNTNSVYSAENKETSGAGIDSVIDSKQTRGDPTVRQLNARKREEIRQQTAGKQWFDMKAPVMTQELKNDLRVLQLRNVLDPKRFYKKDGASKKTPKYFEVGTIVEGPTEFYSSRMTKKERKNNLVDELLADKQARDYFKRKVGEIHSVRNSGRNNGKSFKHKGNGKHKR
ncbi:rrna-processing protein fcf2 [Coemansia sp. Benny D115]|nr:rrna-processing protein fcf2 [Coemansia sp. Benny D115]